LLPPLSFHFSLLALGASPVLLCFAFLLALPHSPSPSLEVTAAAQISPRIAAAVV
jgi:hypothetical protein